MDPVLADRLSKELLGKNIGGWSLRRYIDSGKSALVFMGEKDDKQAALKIFDPDLVIRSGEDNQLARIKRECSLIGEHHPNLVQIYDGGKCSTTNYLYIAMEFIDAPNLKKFLASVPNEKITEIISQLASAAKFLEEKELVHRDIKPENIAINQDCSKVVLLDLGVIRPFFKSDITDMEAKIFIGTLRYSSPEFLMRCEQDTCDGWRALNFYQIGGVLHDLIMKKPLFEEYSEPYANLVEAIKNQRPCIHSDDVNPNIVLLAQNCLSKNPQTRLKLVSWDDFSMSKLADIQDATDNIRYRVKKRVENYSLSKEDISTFPNLVINENIIKKIINRVENIIRDNCLDNTDSFPPFEITNGIKNSNISIITQYSASKERSLPEKLTIFFMVSILDDSTNSINIAAYSYTQAQYTDIDIYSYLDNIYNGSLDSSHLDEVINNFLWSSLDKAQNDN